MFYYEGLSCPVCSNPFAVDEDIVVCPQCGLPHHRHCWKQIGKCFEEDKHGTDRQWSRDRAQHTDAASANSHASSAQICPRCQTQNAEYAEFCNRCGTPLDVKEWCSASAPHPPFNSEYTPFGQPFENYSSTEPIGKSNAADMAAVVGNNAGYYVERFRRIQQGGSGGWNWAAFLLSPVWLFYRKQYGLGTLYLIIHLMSSIASTIIYAPVLLAADTAVAQEAAWAEVMSHPMLPFVAILSYLFLALRILLGVRANYFYFRHCEKKILKKKTDNAHCSVVELAPIGGVSAGAAAGVAVLIYIVAPLLINALVTVVTL